MHTVNQLLTVTFGLGRDEHRLGCSFLSSWEHAGQAQVRLVDIFLEAMPARRCSRELPCKKAGSN